MTRTWLLSAVVMIGALGCPAAVVAAPETAVAGPSRLARGDTASEVRADFDGDGFSDVAIGLDWSVRIAYGSSNGLTATKTQLIPDTRLGGRVPDGLESRGAAHTSGDFDGDGYSDLAVGLFQATVGRVEQAGTVVVLYGSSRGLDVARKQIWTQASPGVAGQAETGDYFGAALAADDFDRSGQDDLAIGVTYESVGGVPEAGAVHVLPGSRSGLTARGSQLWTLASPGVPGRLRSEVFGSGLTTGDFAGDGYADLVVGAPAATVGGRRFAGAVVVLPGGVGGLSSRGAQRWSQETAGIGGRAETYDEFGGTGLATGRFAGGQFDALAIGIPEESVGRAKRAGAVLVLYGSPAGLTARGSQLWSESSRGVAGRPTRDEIFGLDLAAADFGSGGAGLGFEDLAVGVGRGGPDRAGAVHVLYGSKRGLTTHHADYWNEASPGVPGRAEEGDEFGLAIAAADFGKGPVADLVVGAPNEAVGPGEAFIGQFYVLYGTSAELSARGCQVWSSLDYGSDTEWMGDAFETG